MTSHPLMTLQVFVAPPQKLGSVPHGSRVIAPITSGSFEGPRLRGKVLPGGGDWTLLRSDGVLELEPRDAGPIVGYFCMLRDPDGNSVEFSFGQALGPPARRADRQRRQGPTVTRR